MCQFNLQRTFPGLCPFTENFKDQRRAVNHFQIKRLFQIALLDRGQGSIDDQQFDPAGGGRFAKTSDHPFAEISVGTNLPQPDNFGKCHLQIDRRRQPDGFLQPLLRIKGSFFTRRFRINDAGFTAGISNMFSAKTYSLSALAAMSTATPGMMVETACL